MTLLLVNTDRQRRLRGQMQRRGVTVTVAGKAIPAQTRMLTSTESSYLPEGAGNAADADPRLFVLSAIDVPARPAVGSAIAWRGVAYEVTRSTPDDMGGEVLGWDCIVFIVPPSDASTADSLTGQREDYTSADATF